jgi:hypothetical protein
MIRLIFYGFLIYFGYRIMKPWLTSLLRSAGDNPDDKPSSQEAELVRDPQCGTYFLPQSGVEVRIGGRTVHFCCKECRDKYLVSRGGA